MNDQQKPTRRSKSDREQTIDELYRAKMTDPDFIFCLVVGIIAFAIGLINAIFFDSLASAIVAPMGMIGGLLIVVIGFHLEKQSEMLMVLKYLAYRKQDEVEAENKKREDEKKRQAEKALDGILKDAELREKQRK